MAITDWEVFGLQWEEGSMEWINGRNRVDLQIYKKSQKTFQTLKLRIKYFPSIQSLRYDSSITHTMNHIFQSEYKEVPYSTNRI